VDNRNDSEPGVDIRKEPEPLVERRTDSDFSLDGTKAPPEEPNADIRKKSGPIAEISKEFELSLDVVNAPESKVATRNNPDPIAHVRNEFKPSQNGTKKFKRFHCSRCSKYFYRKQNLKAHPCAKREKQISDPQIRCSICPKIFRKLRNLRKHMRMHNGDLPFSCMFCTKSFPEKYRLTAHLMAHGDDKPFCCSLCSKGFKRPDHLRRHVKSHQLNN